MDFTKIIQIAVPVLLGLVFILLVVMLVIIAKQNRAIESAKKEIQELRDDTEDLQKQTVIAAELSSQGIQTMQQSLQGTQSVMQQTVTQSYSELNKVLDNKLAGSFSAINQYLQTLNKDLGEMKTVASGIEDVKKVLSNVKTRGILGEIQLGSILREILSPQQYDENVPTIPYSTERVEYAVKLPGDERPIYLPIDSKFPADTYRHLLDAYDSSDAAAVESAKKQLIQQLKKEANDIRSKYVEVPYTTDFGVMFLPFEGLYAEAINLGVLEILQHDYNVVIAGPSTMAALLSSLQMGFKTLAIQENAQKVWTVLGNVKSEFENFADVLNDTQQKLNKVSESLEKLIGTRTKKIQKALSDVESLEGLGSQDSNEIN